MSYNYHVSPTVRFASAIPKLERETGFAAGSKRFEAALEERGFFVEATYDSGELEYEVFPGVRSPEHEGLPGLVARLRPMFTYAEAGSYTVTDEHGRSVTVDVAVN